MVEAVLTDAEIISASAFKILPVIACIGLNRLEFAGDCLV